MFVRNLARSVTPSCRSIHTTQTVRSGHDTRGIYGSNFPFNPNSTVLMLIYSSIFFGTGIGLPFFSVRQMILSKFA